MQFKTIVAVLSFALAAAALPAADIEARTGSTNTVFLKKTTKVCSPDQKQVCCNKPNVTGSTNNNSGGLVDVLGLTGVLGGLTAQLSCTTVLGQTCSNFNACCSGDQVSQGPALVNLALLNQQCSQLL